MSADAPLILFAPNVHTGGGCVLLQELLDGWPSGRRLRAWLDERARVQLRVPHGAVIDWVKPRIVARWQAERGLARDATAAHRVLCFHGLPPLLARPGQVFVYLQNRNHLGGLPLNEYSWRVRARIRAEQWISRLWRSKVDCYFVQTPSMARALRAWWPAAELRLLPLAPQFMASAPGEPRWDFVYVADGQPHKNHGRLLEAWQLLAARGLRPSLALTFTERDVSLRDQLLTKAREEGLRVENLPAMTHADVQRLYASAHALVFPSLVESFGLPLYEASRFGLPILAGERDFVRDVCCPAQTFDPESAVSIARAVERFLRKEEAPLATMGGADFLRQIEQGVPT